MRPRKPIEVLWVPNRKNCERRAGWSFPKEIEAKIIEICAGGSVLHLFGGRAKFGTRLDIDPATKPDVLGDAWLAAHIFPKASFDTVVLDPPYFKLCREELGQLMAAAAFVARSQAVWLHQLWAPSCFGLSLSRGWLVRVGDSMVVRALQVFRRNSREIQPARYFSRGPAMKYNAWLAGQESLPIANLLQIAKPCDLEIGTLPAPSQKSEAFT